MPAQSSGQATIMDVAAAAGVSIKTVSRVFNDEPNVRAETRARVIEAATALDYHPNLAARSLAGRSSYLIGLAYENPSPNYAVNLQEGALECLHGTRYRLIVLPVESASHVSGRMLQIARASGLAGIILSPPLSDDPVTIEDLSRGGLPFTRIGASSDDRGSPIVRMDDRAAGRDAVQHLIDLGHRRIGIVRGDPTHPSSHERYQGYQEALAAAGLSLDPALVEQGNYTFESGVEAGRRLLAGRNRPSAIFAGNDDMGAGVMNAANESGVRTPEKLSIVGFDDSAISTVVWPRLTTIHQPTHEMAHAAMAALLRLLEGNEPGGLQVLPHHLVVRGSTARPG